MTLKFIDRINELRELERFYKSKYKVALIYGRRRIGKTTLIKEFIKNKKAIYFLASNRKINYNLNLFSEKISKKLSLPSLKFNNFIEAFEFLKKFNYVIVIDEFGFLIEDDQHITSDFQYIIDEILQDSKLKLIISGSTISLFNLHLLNQKSPLYGRIDFKMNLRELPINAIFEWFKDISIEDALKLYFVTNNIPKYLEFFEGKNIEYEIINKMFNPNTFLYNEALILLNEELRDYKTYLLILEAIAKGNTKLTEIANYSFIKPTDAYFYLDVLRKLGIVERVTPIIKSKNSKRGIYIIKDNYFKFWFHFVSPFQTDIESYFPEQAIMYFKKNFNRELGFVFEKFILEGIKTQTILTFHFTRIGKWWHKDKEIDIVGINEFNNEILFAECKWKSNVNAKQVLKELKEKARFVEWNNEKRKEKYAIFAKNFKVKTDEAICVDLKEMEKMLKN